MGRLDKLASVAMLVLWSLYSLASMAMLLPWSLFWPYQTYWGEVKLTGINIKVKVPKKDAFRSGPFSIPPYFWGSHFRNRFMELVGWKPRHGSFPIYTGYSEVRELIGDGTVVDLESLSARAKGIVAALFREVEDAPETKFLVEEKPLSALVSGPTVVQLRLSSNLESWKQEQHSIGNILPPKGAGLVQASEKVLQAFGAGNWPEALKTNNALFGCGLADWVMGAADAPTMFSNYVTDMVFYYEHGYNYIFPSLEPLLQKGLVDPRAMRTLGGYERRNAVAIGKQYVQSKIALEKQSKTHLSNRSGRLSRRMAQILCLSESSLLGMAAEAMARGFDPAAVMSDLVFSSPGTDVVDVGSDLVNSEILNSFLNVTDITDTGIVSEDVLRRVYDAYAATGARMLTQRWHEPLARMCATLYTWHIANDRHMFFRRAILGWPKARKTPAQPQFEADFDEVFDKDYRMTSFSRPLDPRYACDGEETCDHVRHLLNHNSEKPMLRELWWSLVVGPLGYVKGGQIDEQREYDLVEGLRLRLAEAFSQGMVLEMIWLIGHANHHAWQVNYLFEAAMFGSILDGGTLAGKLDRQEED